MYLNQRILIIVAECGEPQFKKIVNLISKQKKVSIEHVVISNKTAIEAEKLIHQYARNAMSNGFDWILRLDGDMVPVDDHVIYRLIKEGNTLNSEFGRLTLPVLDYYTNRQIYGIHLLRSHFIPAHYLETPNRPDHWIDTIPSVLIRKLSKPQILHGFDPNLKQAVRFGLHRGIKARELHKAGGHWLTILDIYLAYRKEPSEIRKAILSSALYGLGYLGDEKIPWESVDFNSIENKKVLEIVSSELFKAEIEKFSRLKYYSFHYKLRRDVMSTIELFIRYSYRNIRYRFIKKKNFHNFLINKEPTDNQ